MKTGTAELIKKLGDAFRQARIVQGPKPILSSAYLSDTLGISERRLRGIVNLYRQYLQQTMVVRVRAGYMWTKDPADLRIFAAGMMKQAATMFETARHSLRVAAQIDRTSECAQQLSLKLDRIAADLSDQLDDLQHQIGESKDAERTAKV